MTDAIAIHGHDVIDLVSQSPDGIRLNQLMEVVDERFGRSVTFRIRISATLCYATEISASAPSNYTNSGVEIFYRSNLDNRSLNKDAGKLTTYASSRPFFQSGSYANEEECRVRHRKWETEIHAPKCAGINDRVLAGFPELQALTPVVLEAEV